MAKVDLGTGYIIEGFNTEGEYRKRLYGHNGMSWRIDLLYQGETSEIPREVAERVVKCLASSSVGKFCQNYEYDLPQPVSFTKTTALGSIQSACKEEYCIIYKNKQL